MINTRQQLEARKISGPFELHPGCSVVKRFNAKADFWLKKQICCSSCYFVKHEAIKTKKLTVLLDRV